MSEYFLIINGQRTGPYSAQEVRQMYQTNGIGNDTLFWTNPMNDWQRIGSAQQLFGISNSPTGVVNYSSQSAYYQPMPMVIQPVMVAMPKSRVAFVLLGLFLGGLGVHNFYAGYTGKGITQLLLNLFLFWTIVVPFLIAIWVIIEVISIDRDANGIRFS